MSRRTPYVVAGIVSATVFAVAIGAGLLESLRTDARLPTADLRYMPALNDMLAEHRYAEASDELYMASLLDPRNVVALDLLARVAAEEGQYQRQIHALKLMLREAPDSPELRLRYALAVLARARASDQALPRRQLQRALWGAEFALRSDPASAPAHAAAGEAALLLGDPESAERYLNEALRLDPSLESARRDLERARSGRGQS